MYQVTAELLPVNEAEGRNSNNVNSLSSRDRGDVKSGVQDAANGVNSRVRASKNTSDLKSKAQKAAKKIKVNQTFKMLLKVRYDEFLMLIFICFHKF